jgi:uncharacterized membrane protein
MEQLLIGSVIRVLISIVTLNTESEKIYIFGKIKK